MDDGQRYAADGHRLGQFGEGRGVDGAAVGDGGGEHRRDLGWVRVGHVEEHPPRARGRQARDELRIEINLSERQYLAGDVLTLVVQFDVVSGRGVVGRRVGGPRPQRC